MKIIDMISMVHRNPVILLHCPRCLKYTDVRVGVFKMQVDQYDVCPECSGEYGIWLQAWHPASSGGCLEIVDERPE